MMTAIAFARNTDISDYTAQSSAWNQNADTLLQDLIQLGKKPFVVSNCAKLSLVRFVFLQRPVRWRGDNQMNAFGGNERKFASITFMNAMLSFVERRWPWDIAQDCICTKHLLDGAGGIVRRGQILQHFCHRINRFPELCGLRVSLRIPPRSCRHWATGPRYKGVSHLLW